jgi:FkbM family methyltransferase
MRVRQSKDLIKHLHSRTIASALYFLEKCFYEPKLKKIYKAELNTHSNLIIFDVGANRGQSIKLFSNCFRDFQVHAFEPSPEVFISLSKKHQNDKVVLNNYGVADTDGSLTFHVAVMDETSTFRLPDLNSSYHKTKSKILITHPMKMYSKIDVKTVKLDTYCEEKSIELVDLLKVDVEGFEKEVLIGATFLFESKAIRRIQIERHEDNLRPNEEDFISEFLTNFNFLKKYSIRHSFGNFHDDFWVLDN